MAVTAENLEEDSEEKEERAADMGEIDKEGIEILEEAEENQEEVEDGLLSDRTDQVVDVQVEAEVIIIDQKKHQIQKILDEDIEGNAGNIRTILEKREINFLDSLRDN